MRRLAIIIICLSLLTWHSVAQDEAPTPTESPALILDVWIPAPLIDDTSSDAYQQLIAHTEQFTADNNIVVNYRIKTVGTVGGIIPTIRTGSQVAPSALPDVTLIQRNDLPLAQTESLFQSMETFFSTALINDLDNILELGQVDTENGQELFGLPYFVDLLGTTYHRTPEITSTALTMSDILTTADNFLFPAGRANGLNQIFYLQYLEAGGIAPNNSNTLINANALETVYQFYEDAVSQRIISPDVIGYNASSAYRADFMKATDTLDFAIVSSSEYLFMHEQDTTLQFGTIPTSSGRARSSISGWVWVMVTPDPAQQDLAVRYLNWMMQPEFHADLSRTINWLPAQSSALEASLPNALDAEWIETLLANSVLPLPDSEGGTVPRAMQEALIAVINGDLTAQEATAQVVDQFAIESD